MFHDRGLGDDYYGPPRPGQTWDAYEAFMSQPVLAASGAVVGAVVFGPVGAIVGGVGAWLAGGSTRHQNKPKIQGG